jgi:hypothetical protein
MYIVLNPHSFIITTAIVYTQHFYHLDPRNPLPIYWLRRTTKSIDACTEHNVLSSPTILHPRTMHSPVSPKTNAYSSAQRSFRCSNESPNFPASEPKPTKIPRTLPSPSQAAFICTICWQHQDPGTKPKLLGTSARIVCHACWRAVLDLSICWVCGECIVRGDEVVSLGWCFWHRGCFGCLMCRTRMNDAALGWQ